MSQTQAIREADRRLTRLRDTLQSDIERLLAQLSTKSGKIEGTADNLANAVRVRGQVLDIIRHEGGPAAMTVAEQQAEKAAASALAAAKTKTPAPSLMAPPAAMTLEAEAVATARASTEGTLDGIVSAWRAAEDEIREAIDRGVNTGASLSDVTRAIKARMKITTDQSRVVAEAAIRGAVTRAQVLVAEQAARTLGEQMGYLYDGPEDEKIRPFCEEVIGKVFTLGALRALDNGQGLPVETHRGGYRCRHRLSPILLSDAAEEGYTVVR